MIDVQALSPTRLPAGRRALAMVEMRRAVLHPVFLISFGLSGLMAWQGLTQPEDWSTAHYGQLVTTMFPLVAGTIITANLISLRARPEEVFGGAVPLDAEWRRQAQLFAGIGPVALTAAVVTLFGIGAALGGGDSIGDLQPQHVTWSVPELAQLVLLVAFSWAFGCALARLIPSRVVGLVIAFIVGFIFVGASWIFQGQPFVALVQMQPFQVELGADFDPGEAPSAWILTAPDEFTRQWRREVVSPAVATGHDLVLAGATVAWSAALWSGRRRWELLGGGVGLVLVGVAAQGFVGIG